MSGDPENQDDELLTDEELVEIESDTSNLDANATHYAKKLLRLYDALERKLMDSYAENRTLRRAANELGCDVCTPEDRRILDAVRDAECPMASCFRADLRRRGIISG